MFVIVHWQSFTFAHFMIAFALCVVSVAIYFAYEWAHRLEEKDKDVDQDDA